MFVAMAVAFTVWSVATPLSLSGAAVGNAWLDIPYALGHLVCSGVIAVVAAYFGQPDIFIFGYLAALVAAVFSFYLYAPALVSRGLESREAIAAVSA
jgi:hypothetical protein